MSKQLYRIGIASSDGKVVNQHFGKATCFYIIEAVLEQQSFDWKIVEIRTVIPACDGGNHDDIKMKESIQNLSDLDYLIVSRVGPGARYVLEQAEIQVLETAGYIEDSLMKFKLVIPLQC